MKLRTKKTSYFTAFSTSFFGFERKVSLMAFMFLLSILIFSTLVIAAARSGSVPMCADKLCQIDHVWTIIQEKLATKLSTVGTTGKEWLGGKVWQNNVWKSFEEAHPRAVVTGAPDEGEEREPETSKEEWIKKFQKDNVVPLGIRQPTFSENKLKEIYGDCRQNPTASCDPSTRVCQENQDFVNANMIPITFLGKNIRVHTKMVNIFKAVDTEIKKTVPSYQPDRIYGYLCRVIGGTNVMSSHAFGVTVDIDPSENPPYSRPSGAACTTNIPEEVVKIFKEHDFCWGGQFGTVCDAMHFEYCKKP